MRAHITYTHTYTQTCLHTHTYTHTHTHACIHTCIHKYTHTCTPRYTHTYTRASTHTCTHTHPHAHHMRTCLYIYMPVFPCACVPPHLCDYMPMCLCTYVPAHFSSPFARTARAIHGLWILNMTSTRLCFGVNHRGIVVSRTTCHDFCRAKMLLRLRPLSFTVHLPTGSLPKRHGGRLVREEVQVWMA
jgi:hypothetical protein